MNRSAEEVQDVGRENHDGGRIDRHYIHNPLLYTHTIDVSNAAALNRVSQPEPVQVDVALSPFYFMELLIPNPRRLPTNDSNENASHGGQVAHGGRGGRAALELVDAPPSYEEAARAHSETAEPPSYEAATKSPGYNSPLFNQDQDFRIPVANSDPEPANHPVVEDESGHGSRGSFMNWITTNLCESFSCCCQYGWQYGPVWTCVIRCLMILFLYFLLKCLVFLIHYIKNH